MRFGFNPLRSGDRLAALSAGIAVGKEPKSMAMASLPLSTW